MAELPSLPGIEVVERVNAFYRLRVKATTSMSAKTKARSFVRLDNPFHKGIISLDEPEMVDDSGKVMKVYQIEATLKNQ